MTTPAALALEIGGNAVEAAGPQDAALRAREKVRLAWSALPVEAQLYVAAVVAAGAAALVTFFPRGIPQPMLFATLFASACLTSIWKINLPIPLTSGATLSVSYAACLMSLLLLGPEQAIVIAAAGAWTQCTFQVKRRYPLYRTIFSTAAAVVTTAATSLVFGALGGETAPLSLWESARPVVSAIGTYFFANTMLIAGVIALSTRQSVFRIWCTDFLWLGASFMVAGAAGALGAAVVANGNQWRAVLLAAPIYLTYRTYQLFIGRLDDEKRHTAETGRLHHEAVAALAEARAARASAEEANRLKDQFLAVVSHELRTPLAAILGWSEILRRRRLDDPLHHRALAAINSSAQRQAALIEDLLDVSRITSGTLRLERTAVDVREIVRDTLQVIEPGAEVKGVLLTVRMDPEVGVVDGDPPRLQQIVSNLLSNAVKFTPSGGAVEVVLRGTDNSVELVVSDTGQGIPRGFLPYVFEPFRQADGSSTRAHSGLGLGLSIVKSLVAAHGGTVTADSDGEGRGATFTVRLPLMRRGHSGAAPASPATATADRPELGTLAGVSVLVVEDDGATREMTALHLQYAQATVWTATSVPEALELVQQQHVDVLLADIGMPDEDGYSLIRRLRALAAPEVASIPAAALTAFSQDQDRLRAVREGFQLHVAKPVDAQTLVSAVRHLHRLRTGHLESVP